MRIPQWGPPGSWGGSHCLDREQLPTHAAPSCARRWPRRGPPRNIGFAQRGKCDIDFPQTQGPMKRAPWISCCARSALLWGIVKHFLFCGILGQRPEPDPGLDIDFSKVKNRRNRPFMRISHFAAWPLGWEPLPGPGATAHPCCPAVGQKMASAWPAQSYWFRAKKEI